MTYQTTTIILMILNMLVAVDAWWLAKQCNKADKRVKELEKELEREKANNRFVMPVAEVKAQFSEEDIKKIKKILKESKVTRCDEQGIVIEEKCECDHLYDSVVLVDDPKYCREKLVFHCDRCGHGKIIPIRKGLITDMVRQGGGA